MNATIDETIERVEHLYTALTGQRPPLANAQRAPIPPENDPALHVQEQLGKMVSAIEGIVPTTSAPSWVPRAAAWTEDRTLVLALDIPGVPRELIQIRLAQQAILVSGQRRPPWTRPPRSVAGCDLLLGAFARSFPIGPRVVAEQLSARLDDGILTIRVHEGTRTEPSQISII
jgi:HSP20 family protein